MRKKLILGAAAVLAVASIVLLFLPWDFYLPHERPVLILPLEAKYDSMAGVMPMGERMEHPNTPWGHPGIDFGVRNITENVPYIASMNGIVSRADIFDNPELEGGEKGGTGKTMLSKTVANVVIRNGPYQTVYTELDGETLPANIKVGASIKQGDIVGYGNFNMINDGSRGEMIHWEFGSTSPMIDRFCPMSYFTEESRVRVESMWARTNQLEMKARYPNICNGFYDGKEG